MNKHTPGPWGYEDPMGGFGILTIVANPTGAVYEWVHVAQIGTESIDGDTRSFEEHQANGRLIAAAPELLEALAMMITWGDEPDPHSKSVRDGQMAGAWAKARAAVARAKGRS